MRDPTPLVIAFLLAVIILLFLCIFVFKQEIEGMQATISSYERITRAEIAKHAEAKHVEATSPPKKRHKQARIVVKQLEPITVRPVITECSRQDKERLWSVFYLTTGESNSVMMTRSLGRWMFSLGPAWLPASSKVFVQAGAGIKF